MARLSDFVSVNRHAVPTSIEELAGKELQVMAFRLKEGVYGEYAFIDVMDEEGKVFTTITGAKVILEALKAARAADALPLPAKFVRKGRRWYVE